MRPVRRGSPRQQDTLRALQAGPLRRLATQTIRSLQDFAVRLEETGHIVVTFTCSHCGERQHQIIKANKKPACVALQEGRAMNLAEQITAVRQEAASAQESYGDFASMHEAFGVLWEEFEELGEAVRMRQGEGDRAHCIAHEAIQVAAVALRMAEQAKRVTR
jgi:hypothetical protein